MTATQIVCYAPRKFTVYNCCPFLFSITSIHSDSDIYEETLPSNLPPSFRGQAVKYSYKLKIGLQRVGAAVKLLHVPFRLMTWQSIFIQF